MHINQISFLFFSFFFWKLRSIFYFFLLSSQMQKDLQKDPLLIFIRNQKKNNLEHYCTSIIVHLLPNKIQSILNNKISYVGNEPSLCEPDSEPLVSSLTLGFFWIFPGFCSHASVKAFIRFSSSVFRQLKNPLSGWLHLTSTAPFLWFLKS